MKRKPIRPDDYERARVHGELDEILSAVREGRAFDPGRALDCAGRYISMPHDRKGPA